MWWTNVWATTCGSLQEMPTCRHLEGRPCPLCLWMGWDCRGTLDTFIEAFDRLHALRLKGRSKMDLWNICRILPGAFLEFPAYQILSRCPSQVLLLDSHMLLNVRHLTGELARRYTRGKPQCRKYTVTPWRYSYWLKLCWSWRCIIQRITMIRVSSPTESWSKAAWDAATSGQPDELLATATHWSLTKVCRIDIFSNCTDPT